jgi:VanZ family protein
MVLPLRHSRLWLVIGWALVIAAILVSLLPGSSLPVTHISDKVEHVACYAVLSIWFAGIYPRTRYAAIAVALLTMGIGVEWAQGAMRAGRESDFLDVVANVTGIFAGLILALVGLGGWAQRVESWARKW